MNMQAIGTVAAAAATSNGVGSLLGAMNSVSNKAGEGRTITTAPVIEARRHVQPADVYEPRKVLHPTARYEARQVFKFDPTMAATSAPAKVKNGHVLPAPVAQTYVRHSKFQKLSLNNTKSNILDMFV